MSERTVSQNPCHNGFGEQCLELSSVCFSSGSLVGEACLIAFNVAQVSYFVGWSTVSVGMCCRQLCTWGGICFAVTSRDCGCDFSQRTRCRNLTYYVPSYLKTLSEYHSQTFLPVATNVRPLQPGNHSVKSNGYHVVRSFCVCEATSKYQPRWSDGDRVLHPDMDLRLDLYKRSTRYRVPCSSIVSAIHSG